MRGTLNAIKITIYIAFSVLQKEAWQLCHDKQLKTMRLHLPFASRRLHGNKMLFQMFIQTARPYCIRNNYFLYYTYAPLTPPTHRTHLSLLIAVTISPFWPHAPPYIISSHESVAFACRLSLALGQNKNEDTPKSRKPGQKASDNCRTDKIGRKEKCFCVWCPAGTPPD